MKNKKHILIVLVILIGFIAPFLVYAATWSPAKRLTWTPGNSEKPFLSIDSSGLIYLFWHDNSPGNQEIFLKKSTDSGATWSPVQRLTWNPGDSKNPGQSLRIAPCISRVGAFFEVNFALSTGIVVIKKIKMIIRIDHKSWIF